MLIEVQRNPKASHETESDISRLVLEFLESKDKRDIFLNFNGSHLHGIVNRISVDRNHKSNEPVFFFYYVNTDGVGNEFVETESTTMNAAQISTLPSSDFEGIWENLHFETNIKQNLLDYAAKAILFSDVHVDANIISWNKIILLYGPPGTGKTSICKGMAQKLAIRRLTRFEVSHFVEINAHSLFSKFFSESGKLVMQIFEKIQEIASDEKSMVFLLIDEVESLAHCRAAAASGNEPSDSIRVVNALLTQLDRLKLLPNVLIMTTSNVESAIDSAFVDRADLNIYIGHPSLSAVSKILSSCVSELVRKDLLMDKSFIDDPELSIVWADICRHSVGISGRALRKLPLLAYTIDKRKMKDFLESLLKLVKAQTSEKKFSQTQQMFQSISLV